MGKKTFFILIGLALLGFFLRSYLLPDNLFFGPEQGTDFKVIRDIVVSHKFTLIGPKTDIAGIFHGPIYYYLGSIPFFISAGDPLVVALFFIGIQSLTVFFIYLLAYEFTGSRRISYTAALLYTISFGAISYSRWLSGQPLTIPLSALFFLFFLRFLKRGKWNLIGAAITYGLLGQVEFINFLLVAATGIVIILRYYKKIFTLPKTFILLSFCVALLFSVGNFVLFDLRHEFLILKSIMGLLKGTKEYYVSLYQSLSATYSMFIHSSMNILGLPNGQITAIILLSILVVFIIGIRKNQYFFVLLSWLLVPNIVLIVLRHGVLEQLYVFLVIGILLGASITIDYIQKKFGTMFGLLILFLLVFTNISLWITALPTNYRIFFQSTQSELRYKDQLHVIDYIYRKAKGKPFYFQSYTIPYFWQDGWEYLFWFVGKKYGYALPDEKYDEHLYVIIQKDRSNPRFQYDWYKNTVNNWGNLQSSVSFGEFTVEERIKEDQYEK